MKRFSWKVAALGIALAAGGAGSGALWAQTAAHRGGARSVLPRKPAFAAKTALSAQELSAKANRVQAQATLLGTLILLEYDSGLTRTLDLDDNGDVQDNGDRALFQGTVWRSDRSGRKIANIGRFTSIFDYLDVSGESTGTDLTQTTDILIYNEGQIRAGGFWDVDDGVGDPALPILGATGRNSTRRYGGGQLLFLGKVVEGQELYFLSR
jgi:hypothetical protein